MHDKPNIVESTYLPANIIAEVPRVGKWHKPSLLRKCQTHEVQLGMRAIERKKANRILVLP